MAVGGRRATGRLRGILQALAEDEIAGLVSVLTAQEIEALAISFVHADQERHPRAARP